MAALTLSPARPAAAGAEILVNGRPIDDESSVAADDGALVHLLDDARDARVVRLVADAPGAEDELFRAQARLIGFLESEAGYDVLVLPVGIFEGFVTDDRLKRGDDPQRAAELLYRVWRENAAFLEMLGGLDGDVELIGGLCRFHAAGKALYTPHLLRFFDQAERGLLGAELRAAIERLWSGRSRLSRASAQTRSEALALADRVLARLDQARSVLARRHGERRVALERHMLVNMRTFVELEELRSGESPRIGELLVRERRQNLEWFLAERFASRKLIYWEGRGDSEAPLPTSEDVFTIRLEARGPAQSSDESGSERPRRIGSSPRRTPKTGAAGSDR